MRPVTNHALKGCGPQNDGGWCCTAERSLRPFWEDILNQHIVIRALAQQHKGRLLNEADTRAMVIDTVIHDVLDWPKTSVKREIAIHPGYADYLLHNTAGQIALIVEAKREGIFFEIPKRQSDLENKRIGFLSIRALLTDQNIKDAITQVRTYCLDVGCNFGCITNGHEWIVFRAFEPGTDWKSLRAFIIPSLESIDSEFTKVFNALSYKCVSHDGALNALISRTPHENRETYRAGHDIPVYTRTIEANKYVQYLRPIAERFFGQIDVAETELMNEVYVSDASYDSAFKSATAILADSVTPFLEDFGVKDTKNDEGGGTFGNRIEKSVVREPRADVVVLFGGKGIGKSTFLRRLLYVRPPQVVRKNAVVALIDLLPVPEDKHAIELYIWNKLVDCMDVDRLLQSDRDVLINLFKDRFEVAQRQNLFGIPSDSIEYNRTLNDLVEKWKSDKQYVARRLGDYLRSKHKGVIVVIDNTDQYRALQEYCFTHAQQIAKTLSCLVVISMREERFYASTIKGVLDAFQNSGFHLGSPSPHNVFLRRLDYVQKLLANSERRTEIFPRGTSDSVVTTVQTLLRNLSSEFRTSGSHLASFLTACAHGNIRLALELFRGLIQSRYTNIDEITSCRDWTWQIHQVLKPVMIPNRFFYEESESYVPNIFQLRSKKRSSHFTALRLLYTLVSYSEIQGASFYSLPQLITDLSNRFHMEEDQKAALDMLLRYGLIESNNRIDEYTDSIDSVRATAYGNHICSDLSSAFTYLDLVSTDTALFEARVCNDLTTLALDEYAIWETLNAVRAKRIERVEKRIQKASEFVAYLEREEAREADLYGLTPHERFMSQIRLKLDAEVENVRKSATRQRY